MTSTTTVGTSPTLSVRRTSPGRAHWRHEHAQPRRSRIPLTSPLKLEYPQSLATYDDYAGAQRAVDFLSDKEFPVENCLIVGTDLKRIERITGRLTAGRVAAGGLASGAWLGLFVGVLFALFDNSSRSGLAIIISTLLLGAAFGVIWGLIGYGATRGRRDFQSVTQVVATKYEVLVEHKVATQARELLAQLPGERPNPFA